MSAGINQDNDAYGALPPIQLEDMLGRDTSDSSNRHYHKPPSEYGHQIWHLGWTDGRHGQPHDDNVAIIHARARLAWQERAAATDAEVGAKTAELRSLEGTLGRLRQRLNLITDDHTNLLRERSENPQSYSLSLWFIYSVVAIVLVAADLPLSLKLVAMGYGIASDSWEAVLLAVGVAVAGILIKYLLDSFIYGDEQRKLTWVFSVPLLLILVLFLGTTFVLGVYRANVERQTEVYRLRTSRSALQEEYNERPNQATKDAIDKLDASIALEESEGWFSWRSGSFIMLTLLFPVAGGICFSVGWRKLIRYLRFRSVNKALKAAESEYKSEELRCEQVRASLASLEARRAREHTAYASGDAYADMLVGIYMHGYERGRNVPETVDAGASLYERCEKAVNKLLARKLRVRYWEMSPSDAREAK